MKGGVEEKRRRKYRRKRDVEEKYCKKMESGIKINERRDGNKRLLKRSKGG
jgi:hypothetical protein